MKIKTVFFIFMILAQLSYAKEITIAIEDNAMPLSGKENQGFSYRLVKEIFKDGPYSVKFLSVPYARVVKMIENDEVDAALHVTKDVENKENFYFSKEVFIIAKAYLYYDKDSNENFKDLSQIPDGTPVGKMIDFEYGKEFQIHKSRFKLFKVSDQEQLINLLKIGRIKVAAMYNRIALHTLKKMGKNHDQLRRGFFLNNSKTYLAFNKKRKHTSELAKFYDKRLRKLKENGTYQKIISY